MKHIYLNKFHREHTERLKKHLLRQPKTLEDAVHGSEWRLALEAISWQVLCWEQGKPEGPQFPSRGAEDPVAELRPVLDLISEELQKRGLKLE